MAKAGKEVVGSKISEFTELSKEGVDILNDFIPIVDSANGESKKIRISNLPFLTGVLDNPTNRGGTLAEYFVSGGYTSGGAPATGLSGAFNNIFTRFTTSGINGAPFSGDGLAQPLAQLVMSIHYKTGDLSTIGAGAGSDPQHSLSRMFGKEENVQRVGIRANQPKTALDIGGKSYFGMATGQTGRGHTGDIIVNHELTGNITTSHIYGANGTEFLSRTGIKISGFEVKNYDSVTQLSGAIYTKLGDIDLVTDIDTETSGDSSTGFHHAYHPGALNFPSGHLNVDSGNASGNFGGTNVALLSRNRILIEPNPRLSGSLFTSAQGLRPMHGVSAVSTGLLVRDRFISHSYYPLHPEYWNDNDHSTSNFTNGSYELFDYLNGNQIIPAITSTSVVMKDCIFKINYAGTPLTAYNTGMTGNNAIAAGSGAAATGSWGDMNIVEALGGGRGYQTYAKLPSSFMASLTGTSPATYLYHRDTPVIGALYSTNAQNLHLVTSNPFQRSGSFRGTTVEIIFEYQKYHKDRSFDRDEDNSVFT